VEVVLDANVLVSAIATPGGTCERVLDGVLDGPVTLITSPTLLAEVGRVLARPRFDHVPASMRDDFLEMLVRAATVVDDPRSDERLPGAEDPGDAYLVRLALAAPGRLLVTGDRHLLDHADVLPVVTPADLLRALEAMRAQP
jgi:putative PIN family toxin of toxin-antitoxin system